jgi:hemoglobin
MKKLSKMMKGFLTMVFGGFFILFLYLFKKSPSNYTGKSMKDAHAGMKLSDTLFDDTVNHLADTLKELGVSSDLILEIAEVAESIRDEVLGR